MLHFHAKRLAMKMEDRPATLLRMISSWEVGCCTNNWIILDHNSDMRKKGTKTTLYFEHSHSRELERTN